jgi:hypothetical protein
MLVLGLSELGVFDEICPKLWAKIAGARSGWTRAGWRDSGAAGLQGDVVPLAVGDALVRVE